MLTNERMWHNYYRLRQLYVRTSFPPAAAGGRTYAPKHSSTNLREQIGGRSAAEKDEEDRTKDWVTTDGEDDNSHGRLESSLSQISSKPGQNLRAFSSSKNKTMVVQTTAHRERSGDERSERRHYTNDDKMIYSS